MRAIQTPINMYDFRIMSKERQCHIGRKISRVCHVVMVVYRKLQMYSNRVAVYYETPTGGCEKTG
jgi:hypothetical protein